MQMYVQYLYMLYIKFSTLVKDIWLFPHLTLDSVHIPIVIVIFVCLFFKDYNPVKKIKT